VKVRAQEGKGSRVESSKTKGQLVERIEKGIALSILQERLQEGLGLHWGSSKARTRKKRKGLDTCEERIGSLTVLKGSPGTYTAKR